MFKSDANDKETKDDSRMKSLGGDKQSPPIPEKIPFTAPQPKGSADVSQRKLQQKFAAQRRKDLLAIQASQAGRAAEENEQVLNASSVSDASSVPESTKRSLKKFHTRAERSERRRKLEKVALSKKTVKRITQPRVKPMKVPPDEVTETTKPATPQNAEEPSTSVEASAGKSQGTLGAEGNESIGKDSKGNVSGGQTATAQKLDDIMKILESSKNRGMPEHPLNVGRKAKSSSTDTNRKAKVVATLKKLQSSGERPAVKSRKAAAIISYYSTQLLAYLKAKPEEMTDSLRQLRELHKKLSGENVWNTTLLTGPLVRRLTNSLTPSIEAALKPNLKNRKPVKRLPSNSKKNISTKKSKTSTLESDVPGSKSLQAALRQRFGKVKSTELDSLQLLPSEKAKKVKALSKTPIEMATASELEIMPVKVDQPPVPRLAYGLERVLFNPGVYQLQDPRSRVYNFDPYLQKIMPVAEFDFSALKEYITSSRDQSLIKIAKEHGKRYMGSTSSMTEVLAQFHFLLSQWRPINPSMLSKHFPVNTTKFTELQRTPSAIFLRWKDGSYAIDADKQFASANVLSMLGKSMEKLLTLSTDDFERYRKSNPGQVTEEEQFAPESYHYSTLGDFLMRSQLDAHDPRLPGTGMFDLKTRSVVSIRMDVTNYEHGVGYEIKSRQGEWESYEREYHDMIRAAFLKYSLQVRMGRMDGIFVAFHNIERIFGFQYISLPEMDYTLHGQYDTSIGDQEFRLSLDLMNKVLDRATKKYPQTSLRIHFETRDVHTPFMYIFAEPVTEEQVAEIQSHNEVKIQEFERNILGLKRGAGSEKDDAQEDDSRWEDIQADVQEAMDKDELSIDESDQNQEAIDEDAEGIGSALARPEVFEQGPLYAGKSLAGADYDVTAASAGTEVDDGDSEDDDVDGEEEEEDGDGDANEDGEVEDSRLQEGLEESLEDKADIKANDAGEEERVVGGDSTGENDVAPRDTHLEEVRNDGNLQTEGRNEDDVAGATSGQESEAAESLDGMADTSISLGANPNDVSDEGQEEHEIEADQSFLDSLDQEKAQADTAAKTNSSEDILAMTLTLRNQVNGEYVLRPEKMTAADEWSIEYSLVEVSEQRRARALYQACQRRRSKKMEALSVREDAEVVNYYVQMLRDMSAKGRAWRKEQDRKDRKQPVQVL